MSMRRPLLPIEILLVEDDAGDAVLTRKALGNSEIKHTIQVVTNGVDALAFLRREPPHTDAVRPDLILLDLNLPRKDGREVLAEVKADSNLRQIPVVILTTSSAEQDIVRGYDLHANAYVTKPVDLAEFMHAIRSIDDFFVTVARRPPRRE